MYRIFGNGSEFSIGFVSKGLVFLAEIAVADHLLDLSPSSFKLVVLSEMLVGSSILFGNHMPWLHGLPQSVGSHLW